MPSTRRPNETQHFSHQALARRVVRLALCLHSTSGMTSHKASKRREGPAWTPVAMAMMTAVFLANTPALAQASGKPAMSKRARPTASQVARDQRPNTQFKPGRLGESRMRRGIGQRGIGHGAAKPAADISLTRQARGLQRSKVRAAKRVALRQAFDKMYGEGLAKSDASFKRASRLATVVTTVGVAVSTLMIPFITSMNGSIDSQLLSTFANTIMFGGMPGLGTFLALYTPMKVDARLVTVAKQLRASGDGSPEVARVIAMAASEAEAVASE